MADEFQDEERRLSDMADAAEMLIDAKKDGTLDEILAKQEAMSRPRAAFSFVSLEGLKIESVNADKMVSELKTKLQQRRVEAADVHYSLNKRLDDNYNIISELERRILRMETDWERDEIRLGEMRKAHEAQLKLKLEEERKSVEAARENVQKLRPFMNERADVASRHDALNKQLAAYETEERKKIDDRERQLIKERAKLKAKNAEDVRNKIEVLRQSTDEKREETIVTTVADNDVLHDQLAAQRLVSEKEYFRFKAITEENARLTRDLRLTVSYNDEAEEKLVLSEQRLKNLLRICEELRGDDDSSVGSSFLAAPTPTTMDSMSLGGSSSLTSLGCYDEDEELVELRAKLTNMLREEKALEAALRASERSGDSLAFATLEEAYQMEQAYARKNLSKKTRKYGEQKTLPSFTRLSPEATARAIRKLLRSLVARGFHNCDVRTRIQEALSLPPIAAPPDVDECSVSSEELSAVFPGPVEDERSISRSSTHGGGLYQTVATQTEEMPSLARLMRKGARGLASNTRGKFDRARARAPPQDGGGEPTLNRAEETAHLQLQHRHVPNRHTKAYPPTKPRDVNLGPMVSRLNVAR
mmetsp:Transcript_20006/g.60584  ORF Transcript_20006/g.60584 Transcript_20006/m.60584 type:complete len:588 (-) Transcript_20006:70-1833(-)